MRDNFDLAVALLADLHGIAQIPHPVIDFDLVVQEFLKRGDVEDLVRCGLRGVDDVLQIAPEPALAADIVLGVFSMTWTGQQLDMGLGGENLPSWLFWPACLLWCRGGCQPTVRERRENT